MGKGSTRRPEDTKKIETNWPFPPKPKFWAIVVMLLSTCVAPRLVPAQTPAQDSVRVLRADLDSLERELRKIDSLKGDFAGAYRNAYHPTRWYAGALFGGVALNAALGIDRDPGGYRDSWTTPDKWQHFSVAMFLTERAGMMRVPMRWAVPITCATAVGWEFSQGHVSGKDIGAGCAGAVSAAGFRWLLDHRPKKVMFGP